jgi:hypothetical protein
MTDGYPTDPEWMFDDDTLELWGERFADVHCRTRVADDNLPPAEQHSDDWITGRAVLQLTYELINLVMTDAFELYEDTPAEIDSKGLTAYPD